MTKSYWIAFLDLLFCMLFIVLMMIQPKPTDPALEPPGNLMIYTTWPDTGQDVDTWMIGPEMKKPIGYDHKNSETCDLLKDDLGVTKEDIGVNYENIFCRGLPDGEYIVNVHAFHVESFPLEVNIQVAVDGEVLFTEKVLFNSPKEEVTVIRFKLKDGKLVPGSAHHVFLSLFDYRKGQS